MLRIFAILVLFLSAVQTQLFRPETRHRLVPFMRPPQQRFQEPQVRFQGAPSNIAAEVRPPPQPESFISGATAFFERPNHSMGDLPLTNMPSFDLVPPPSTEETNDPSNEGEEPSSPDFPFQEAAEVKEEESFDEESAGNEGAGAEGPDQNEPELGQDTEENPEDPNAKSFNEINPFRFGGEEEPEEATPKEDTHEGKNHKREANPQDSGVNFNFPNFQQQSNNHRQQFNSFDHNNQGIRGENPHVDPSRQNPNIPPIYKPERNPNFRPEGSPSSQPSPHTSLNGFRPPVHGGEEIPSAFAFSEQSKPKPEFNLRQNVNPNRPPPQHERQQPHQPQPERHQQQTERHQPQPERHQPQPERHQFLERPSRPERPVAPVERQDRPARPERFERPDNKPSFQAPEQQQRRQQEEQEPPKFQFPSFNEAQTNAKPFHQIDEVEHSPSRAIGQQQLQQTQIKKGTLKRRPFKKRQEPKYQAEEVAQNQVFQGYQEEEEEETPDRLSTLLLETSFNCQKRKNGYYADEELSCEVFHFCQDTVKHSWLCPNGGSFHQVHLICLPRTEDNICEKSSKFHFVNDYLYHETGTGTNKGYSQRYYPDGYTEGIAALEERHAISEQAPTPEEHQPSQETRTPQQPPRNLYQFAPQQDAPRQVQLGPPLKQAQRLSFAEADDYQDGNLNFEQQFEESQDYPAFEEPPRRASPNVRRPVSNVRPGVSFV